jgi:DDE_Tnp_1-associated
LRQVGDFRRREGKRYPLAETLCMLVMGMMSGYQGYRQLGRFMRHNQQALVDYLHLAKSRVPSYVTIRHLLQHLDFEQLNQAFTHWSSQYVDWSGQWLSIDGKSLKSTVSAYDSKEQNFVMLVSAFSQQTGLVRQVVRLENGKSSEIASVQTLIGQLQTKGLLLTLDALHCQKKQ